MISPSNLATVISIPLVSAAIGYITNYIAVKMLFRPRNPVSFCGIRVHGLVPKRQKEIAASLGKMIERDLISHSDIQSVLKGKETAEEAAKFLHEQVDQFVIKLTGQNPMVGAFLQGPMLDQVKGVLSNQMTERFPDFMGRVVDRVEKGLDIKAVIQGKIEAFDLSKLESLIYEISARELKTIELLGGVLGFLVGVVQVALMMALGSL